jgi:hypothetical protein
MSRWFERTAHLQQGGMKVAAQAFSSRLSTCLLLP